jgi:hypothetical protein
MRKLITLAVIGVAALSIGAPRSLAASNEDTSGFVASLAGRNEIPPVTGGMTGTARFHLTDGNKALAFSLTLDDTTQVFVAHIHVGPKDKNGPVVAFLFGPLPIPPGLTQDSVRIEGFLTDANMTGAGGITTIAGLVAAMKAGNTYVNAHTVAHQGGASRGQISVSSDNNGDG